MEVNLRAVEGTVSLVDHIGHMQLLQGRLEAVGGRLPVLRCPDMILRHGGQLDVIFKAEFAVNLVDQRHNALDFVRDLLLRHKNVGIVLRKAADTHQAVQRTGFLVAVHDAELTHADRKITVGMGLHFINQHAARAVHRLDGKILIVDDGGVHIGLVMIPVTGSLPQLTVEHDGGADLHIAGLPVNVAPILDQLVFQNHSLRQEEREAGALLHQSKQPELLAELAVVALLGLLNLLKVGIQLGLFRKRRTVDTLQHLVFLVAAPVGTGAGGELDGLDPSGIRQMGAGAQIHKIALTVEGDGLALGGVLLEQLQLIRLIRHQLTGLLRRQKKLLNRKCFLDDFIHFLLNGGQILRQKRLFAVEIVIKSAVDGGADGQLGIREQTQHGLCQNVGRGMAVGLLAVLVVEGQNLKLRILVENRAQIHDLAVQASGACSAVQSHGDVAAQRLDGGPFFHLTDIAALASNVQHFFIPP